MPMQHEISQSKTIAFQLLDAIPIPKDQDVVFESFSDLIQRINETAGFQQALSNPLISIAKKQDLIRATLEKYTLPASVLSFFAIVAELGIAKLIPMIMTQFIDHYNVHHNRFTAEITATKPLPKKCLADIHETLKTHLKGDIVLKEKIDPDILGGLIIKVNGKLFDASLRRDLSFITQSLKGMPT